MVWSREACYMLLWTTGNVKLTHRLFGELSIEYFWEAVHLWVAETRKGKPGSGGPPRKPWPCFTRLMARIISPHVCLCPHFAVFHGAVQSHRWLSLLSLYTLTCLAVLSSLGQEERTALQTVNCLLFSSVRKALPWHLPWLFISCLLQDFVPLRRQRQMFLCIGGQPGPHSNFQESHGYVESNPLVKQRKTKDCSKVRVHHLNISHLHLCPFPTSYLSKALYLSLDAF